MKSDDELIAELQQATRGLLFMSESDYPFEVFKWEGVAEPSPDFLRGLTKENDTAPIEALTVADFFRVAASEPEWKGEAELVTARKFQALMKLLEKNLSNLRVWRVGTINMPVYIVGRAASGTLIGVSTRSVET